jgi:DNA-binding LacI/PurR family transcriptional regulator
MRPVTIRDVARRAGVSSSTVSQVLNGRSGWASAETGARILAAARELNYRPSAIARGLVLARTGTLGVVITSIVHPLFHKLLEGIEQVADHPQGHQRRAAATVPRNPGAGARRPRLQRPASMTPRVVHPRTDSARR